MLQIGHAILQTLPHESIIMWSSVRLAQNLKKKHAIFWDTHKIYCHQTFFARPKMFFLIFSTQLSDVPPCFDSFKCVAMLIIISFIPGVND